MAPLAVIVPDCPEHMLIGVAVTLGKLNTVTAVSYTHLSSDFPSAVVYFMI